MRYQALAVCILLVLATCRTVLAQPPGADPPLIAAVKQNDLASVERLLSQGADINAADSNSATPLMWAAYNGNLPVFKYLVQKGADYKKKGVIFLDSTRNSYYGNILGIAAARNDSLLLAYCLDKLTMSPNDKEYNPESGKENGWTPLHWAASKGSLATARLLVEHGAAVNEVYSFDGNTPLLYAAKEGFYDIANYLLLQDTTRIDQKDRYGWQFIHYLCRDLDNAGLMGLTIRRGSHFDEQLPEGLTPLMLSALNNRIHSVIALLLAGANPSLKNSIGESAADLAYNKGYYIPSLVIKRFMGGYSAENLKPLLDSINLVSQLYQAGDSCRRIADTSEALRYFNAQLNLLGNLYGVGHPLYGYCSSDIIELLKSQKQNDLRLILPEGHKNTITYLDYSWDGNYIVSASKDQTAKLWDARNGRLIYTLNGHQGPVRSSEFSPDGKKIITAAGDANMIVWDVMNGNQQKVLQAQRFVDCYCNASFSSDGRHIITANNNFATVFSADRGSFVGGVDTQAVFHVYGYAYCGKWFAKYTPDDRYIVTAIEDSVATVWNATSFEMIRQLKGHRGIITSLQVGKKSGDLLTTSEDSTTILWNIETGEIIGKFHFDEKKISNSIVSPDASSIVSVADSMIVFYDLERGKTIRVAQNKSGIVSNVAFSPDSKLLAVTDFANYISLWDAKRGNVIKFKVFDEPITAVKFSPTGNEIAVANNANIYLFSSIDLSLLRVLSTNIFPFKLLATNKDGTQFVSTALASDHSLRVWNLKQGSLEEDILGHKGQISEGVYTGDGNFFITCSDDSTIKLWDTKTWNCQWTFRCEGIPQSLQLSKNGKYIAFSYSNGLVCLLRADSLKKLFSTETVTGLNKIRFCLGGDRLLFASKSGTFGVLDIKSESIIFKTRYEESFPKFRNADIDVTDDQLHFMFTFDGKGAIYNAQTLGIEGRFDHSNHSPPVASIKFGKSYQEYYVLRTDDGLISERLDGSGENLLAGDRQRETPENALSKYSVNNRVTNTIVLTRDSRYVIALNDSLLVYDLQLRKAVLKTIALDFRVSNNGKILVYSDGSQAYSFSLEHNEIMARYISMNEYDKGYVTLIKDGYYQGNKDCIKRLSYGDRNRVFDFSQFDINYNRPDKVLSNLDRFYKDSNTASFVKVYKKAYEKRIYRLGFDTISPSSYKLFPVCEIINRSSLTTVRDVSRITLRVMAFDSILFLKSFNVSINSVPLFGRKGVQFDNKYRSFFDTTIQVNVNTGKNIIRAFVINNGGNESVTWPLTVNLSNVLSYYYDRYSDSLGLPPITFESHQPEKLYFIGIGVNKFKEKGHALSWSVKDIRDLAKAFKKKYKNNCNIDTLFDENVTVRNVKELKKKLLQISANDKVIVAYSGHGLLSKEFDYYLSTYDVNFERPNVNGLPYDEIENLLDSIPARKKLLLIDACHSGEVDKEEMQNYSLVKSEGDTVKGLVLGNKNLPTMGIKSSFELMQALFVDVSKNTGATIISAAGGTQFALEANNLQNGIFTYSILEYLQQHEHTKLSQLKQYVNLRVPELTKGLQIPTSRSEIVDADWDVW